MVQRIALSLILCFSAEAKVLLWDLGGVLFEPNKLGFAMEIGLGHFVRHVFWDMRSPDITHTLFDVIAMLMPRDPSLPLIGGSNSGKTLPPIMSHWQAGTITGQEIINRSHKLLQRLYECDYFESKEHMRLISRCIHKMFNPEVLANNVEISWPGVRLLEECARQKHKDGTKKHRLFIFSNWDNISFDLFKKKHRKIFSMFEGTIISGHIKRVKPARNAYDYLIETYGFDPEDCILIDDQEINTRAALLYGMNAALIRNNDFVRLRKDLVGLGVLD